MSRPTFAEVNLAAVRGNFLALRALLAPKVKMAGIVKADAYGHGAVPVARTLQAAGCDMFAVAMVEEAVELRVAGILRPILVMGAIPADEIAAALEYDLRPTIDDLATAREIERQAAPHGRTVAVHLKIDTGMNRLGVRAEDAAAAAQAIAGMPHLVLEGAFTHFACADLDGHAATGGQLERFRAALDAMRAAGVLPPLVHAANSSALIAVAAAHFDMVRPGLALYGIRPCAAARSVPLVPALALKSRVAHIKCVRRGESASYGHRWTAARDSCLALLPIGYADGYPRALSNCGQVRVGGRLCPVVGTICMDATLVDVTDVPDVRVGLEATLLEAEHDSPLSAEAVAALCHTIPYEILTGIGRRVPRLYPHSGEK